MYKGLFYGLLASSIYGLVYNYFNGIMNIYEIMVSVSLLGVGTTLWLWIKPHESDEDTD